MFCYQCANCSQERLTSHQYTASHNDNTRGDSNTDNTRRDINSAAGRTHHSNCNPVKPTQLPGIHTIFSPRYSVYVDECDRPVKVDLKHNKNTSSPTTAEGSSLVKLYDSQDNFSTPQHDDDITAHGSGHVREEHDFCITCRKPLSKSLVVHNRIHTGEKSSYCGAQEKALPKQVTESKHNRAHNGEKGEKGVKGENGEMGDKGEKDRSHKGDKRYPCSMCDKPFTTKRNLSRHIICVHERQKKFLCEICGKLFCLKADFLTHSRIHTGEKPHCCETCGKSFVQKVSLIEHIHKHTGKKPYLCTICNKRFAHSPTLFRHKRSKH